MSTMPMLTWAIPQNEPLLTNESVHVWSASLDVDQSILTQLHQCLSDDEQNKVAEFVFAGDRDHYVASRGLLRLLLSRYTGVPHKHLAFCLNDYGKPSLANELRMDGLKFNLSHSHGVVLFAVTEECEVGVDVEFVRNGVVDQTIVEKFFSPAEVRTLRALPPTKQQDAFFRCWTRKEAYIKARGLGLSLPLETFDVSLGPDEPAALLATRPDAQERSKWSLEELSPCSGYSAAIAMEGICKELQCWQLSPSYLLTSFSSGTPAGIH